MAEVVDSIIAELILKSQGYAEGFDAATAAHGRFQKSVDALKGQTFDLSAEAQKYKGGLDQIAGSEEQTTARVVRTRKARTDAEKEAAAAEKAAAKDAAAAVKAAEKEKADAAKAAARERAAAAKEAAKAEADAAKEAVARAAAVAEAERRLAVASQAATRAEIENLERLKAAERESTNQARANSFLTGGGNQAGSARASASVFVENFKAEAAAAKEAEKAEADLAKARGDTSLAAEQERLRTQELTARRRAALQARQDARQSPSSGPTIVEPNAGRTITQADYDAALARTEAARAAVAGPGPVSRVGLTGSEPAAAEREVNSALLEQASLRAGINAGDKEAAAYAKDQLTYINLRTAALRANLSEEDATIFAEERLLAIQQARFEQALKQVAVQRAQTSGMQSGGTKDIARFAEGAGLGRSFGSLATVGGIAAAAGVGIGAEAVKSATEYAQALTEVSHQAGLSAEALQVYQHAAVDAGAKSTDFDTGLLHLSDALGRARDGSQEQAKAFAALGINIKGATSAGDLIPTLIQRFSEVADQSKRSDAEMILFGESGEKLDGLLSGGTQKVNALAKALQDTGAILSSSDIAKLDDTSKKLAAVKAQLQVDLAEVVAGNAEAIESLATSFAQLANDIGSVIKAFDQYAKTPGLGMALANPAGAGGRFRDYLTEETNKGITALGIPGFGPGATAKPVDPTDAVNRGLAAVDAADPFLKGIQSGHVDLNALSHLHDPKGRKGPNPNTAENEADERTKRFNDLMARYQDEQLAAVAQQTSDEAERADQQRAKIQRDAAKDIADLQTQAQIDGRKKGADEGLIQARLAQEIAARKAVAAEQTNVVNLQENLSAIRRDTAAQVARLEFSNQLLADGQRSTDTSAQRQKVALEMLANEEKIKEITANEVLRRAAQGDPTITQADVDAANRTIANIPAETAAATGRIKDQTKSPGQTYADSLRFTSDTVQDLGVKELQTFNSELDKSVEKATHLHGIFGSIVNDLIDMAIKQAIIAPLAGSLFGGGGSASAAGGLFGGSGGGLLGAIGGAIGNLAIPGFATGGGGIIGGNPGIDQNLLSLNGKPIARVGQGEQLSVSPNIGAANGKVVSQQSSVVIVQPIHADFSGARTDEQTMKQFQDYADQSSARAYSAAVATAGRQVSGIVQRKQTLGS